MALDTALKRASSANVGCPWRGFLPLPDTSVEAVDRRCVGFLFAGNVGVGPVQVEQIGNISVESDTGSHAFDLSVYFLGALTYSIAPAVEAGWSFDTGTGILTVDTDVDSTFGPYVVTATNASGNTDSNGFTVLVQTSTVRAYRGMSGRSGLWRYVY